MSKEKFLQTYGPDHHREADIEKTGGSLYTMASPLLSHEHMDKIIKKDPKKLSRIVQGNANVPVHIIDQFLNSDVGKNVGICEKVSTITRNENTSTENLKKLIPHVKTFNDIGDIVDHKNFNEDVMHHLVNSGIDNLPIKFSTLDTRKIGKFLTDDHIKTLLDHKDIHTRTLASSFVAQKYAKNQLDETAKIPSHFIDYMVNHKNPRVQEGVTNFRSSLLPHHIDKLLKSDDEVTRYQTLRSPNATKEHFQRHINDPDIDVKDLAQRKLKEF